MKDTPLKSMLFKHFWAQRFFVQAEVDIFPVGGVSRTRKAITDIDVYALRPSRALTFERVLGDCKTLKSQSPVQRALWVAGLMRLLDAHGGIIMLTAPGGIEQDHKLTADELGITLLSVEDFPTFDRALLPPLGSSGVTVEPSDIEKIHGVHNHFPALYPLCEYLTSTAWQEPTFGALIRHVLGILRSLKGEFDPKRTEHEALLCDTAAVFAVGLAECAGRVFNQYLHPAKKTELADSLKALLWGGRESYEAYQSIRAKLVASRGFRADLSDEDPGLPEWNGFVQVVRQYLETPATAFHVPWLLRAYAVTLLKGESFNSIPLTRSDLHLLKLAMFTLDYVCRAAGVPKEFADLVTYPLIQAQSQFALAPAAAVPTVELPAQDPFQIKLF
ncbi:hypothetical protein LZ198_41245 [Myxococcus sp. K15C18031901]|uniref:hypothetical protein n=1 Tax=Myxococcus dinghuensis TaxID=2906761 RepID=UPI0020A7525A|nr:hypothetical protein [Myxococcus dinghuensis]MCP3105313.1 hypothetical protein [Myxococcus dinghuensis]